MSDSLFAPTRLGTLELQNRIVMAPMTRSRSPGNVPGELVAEYYAQRASAGLQISEGTSPSPNGLGYARIPGLYSAEQTAGWKRVADAVHGAGGRIFVQLMHTGRVGHGNNLPAGARVLGPSAIVLEGEMYTDQEGPKPHPVPVEMSEADIEVTLGEFGIAAGRALEAGLDGVELHGANGYLIDQFLNTGSNQRTDRWGGSIDNRLRFALAAVDQVKARVGKERTGIRLSPYGVFNGMKPDADMHALYVQLAHELGARGIAYLHFVDHSSMGAPKPSPETFEAMRQAFGGAIILSGGYDAARAQADLDAAKGELVAFGRPFISNPNLPEKLRAGAALRTPDEATFYTPGPKGYTDYPTD